MNNHNQQKGMNPFAAGMTGLVIGAIGTAVGIAMSNKDNREKVQQKARAVSDWSNKKVREMKKTTDDTLGTAETKIQDIRKDVKADTNNRTGRTTQK